MDPGRQDRAYWVKTLSRMAEPVLTACAERRLRATMPVESNGSHREQFAHLEALGRLLAGMAPWLERTALDAQEEEARQRYAALARQALEAATDPASPDYCNFSFSFQPVVDAAFLAHALLRAPIELWAMLDARVQGNILDALLLTRKQKPFSNNWLLFSALIETALYRFGQVPWDPMRIDYALKQHEQWYLGDGLYGDGPDLHFDYYNSFVIHPMLIDIITTMGLYYPDWEHLRGSILQRAQRYAVLLERMISPEGTFPVVGRSLSYRLGVFHLLAQIALRQELPVSVSPAQVRCALTAAMRRVMDMPGTFDEQGWLTIGLCGHQPELGEAYISTGSLYLCSTAFLPLGLPADNPFWLGEAPWTSQKAWSGKHVFIDAHLEA